MCVCVRRRGGWLSEVCVAGEHQDERGNPSNQTLKCQGLCVALHGGGGGGGGVTVV